MPERRKESTLSPLPPGSPNERTRSPTQALPYLTPTTSKSAVSFNEGDTTVYMLAAPQRDNDIDTTK